MPRVCTICAHKDRNKIDSAIAVDGAILRTIAHQYDLSESALKRHVKNNHVSEQIAKAEHINEVIHADGVLTEMGRIKKETWLIHKECRERKRKDKEGKESNDPDNELALKALARLEKQLEIESKVLGVVKDPPQNSPVTVNLNIAEEVKKLVGILPAVKT